MRYQVTPAISIEECHITFDFVRSSAPGGQNVNKVSTAVELRFDCANAGLPEAVKERFAILAGRRLNQDGVVVIKAQRFRSQERNRVDALERLFALISAASVPVLTRRATKPTWGSKLRRLDEKKVIKTVKQNRRPVRDEI